jgi:hypothetical protein
MRALGIVIIVIGVLIVVAGILYFTEPAHSLPSFFPGYVAHKNVKHPRRGLVGLIIGLIVIAIGAIVALSAGRKSSGVSAP